MSSSILSRPKTDPVRSAKVGVDEKDTDGISFAMKCPVLASALSAPLDEFVAVLKVFLKKGKDLPEWKGTGFINFGKPIPLPKVLQLCDLVSSSCLLHYAAMNSVKHVQHLLGLGMKPFVNFRNLQGNTPLHIACGRGDLAALQLLLRHGANAALVNGEKVSCLHSAVTSENLEVVQAMLRVIQTAALADRDGTTPYELALQCHAKNESLFAESQAKYQLLALRLEELQADPDAASEEVKTLVAAEFEAIGKAKLAMDNTKSICDYLLQETGKSTRTEVLLSLLQSAARHGQIDAVDWLVKERKVAVDQVSSLYPMPALITAAGHGHAGVVQLLVALGADINSSIQRPAPEIPVFVSEATGMALSSQRYDALHAALSGGHEEAAMAILSHPGFTLHCAENSNITDDAMMASIGGIDIGGLSLHDATANTTARVSSTESITTVKQLMELLQPFVRDDNLRTLPSHLKLAAQAGMRGAVSALLARGAAVNALHSEIEVSATHLANSEAVAAGLEIIVGSDELTPLASACARGHTEVALLLLEAGADPNMTLLSHFNKHGLDLVKGPAMQLELAAGRAIPVHFTFRTNACSPLVQALRFRHARIVHALVARGADPNAPTLQHSTAAHAAAHSAEALAYLQANGGRLWQCDNHWQTPLCFATKEDSAESAVFLLASAPPHAFSAEAANLMSFLFKMQISEQIPVAAKIQAMRAALYVKSEAPGEFHGAVIRAFRVAIANGAPLCARVLLASMRGKWVCLSAPAGSERLVHLEIEGRPVYTALDPHGLVARTVDGEYVSQHTGDNTRVCMPLAAYLATEMLVAVCQKEQLTMLLDLLEQGAMPALAGLQGRTYLDAFHKLYKVTDGRIVCREAAAPLEISNQPYSPLAVALVNGHQHIVQVLLGCTPDSHKLVKSDNELNAIGKQLEQYLPLVELLPQSRLDRVPPHLHPTGIRSLAARSGARGYAPLHLASMDEYPLLTALLLKAHAPVDVQDDEGNTPLHTAIRHSAIKTLEVLMFSKARADIANKHGYTAVHVAALFERPALVKGLVAHCNGDLYQPTPDGQSVVELVNAAQAKQDVAVYAK